MPSITRQQRRQLDRRIRKIEKKKKQATGGLPFLETCDRINIYACDQHEVVTVDRVKGTTPMQIICPVCGKWAMSRFYNVDQSLEPVLEWIQPPAEALRYMAKAEVEHYQQGGLYLRKIQTPK